MRKDETVLRSATRSLSDIDAIEPGRVDLWCYFPELNSDPELLSAQASLMASDEHERCARFAFERDRRQFIATRALVRAVLSSYFPIAPSDWRFSLAKHGKPSVAYPSLAPGIHFNLAHTLGLVVCAVSFVHESVGVDAEIITADRDIVSLAERYFSASEIHALRACPSSKQSGRFFAYWTLKESYAKARGDGLRLALDRSSFHFQEDAIQIVTEPSLADDDRSWRFALVQGSQNHLIAVAVKTDGPPLRLRIRQAVPLGKVTKKIELSPILPSDI